MEKSQQLDWHEFIVRTPDGVRALILYGSFDVADSEAVEFCIENDFEYLKYSGVSRDADPGRDEGPLSEELEDDQSIRSFCQGKK